MAGDWIPTSTNLVSKAEVVRIARDSGRSRHEVVGLLVHFWSWVSEETSTGTIDGVFVGDLPDIIGGDSAFWAAVESVGWVLDTVDGIEIPNADSWLTNGAKARLQKNKRQAEWRRGATVDACVDGHVDAHVDGDASTQAPTTEEKRREEKRKEEKREEGNPASSVDGSGETLFIEQPLPDEPKPFDQFVEAWNSQAERLGIPQCKKATESRKRAFRARWADQFWRDHFREAIDRIPEDPSRLGSAKGWVANIDWFLVEGTVPQIIEYRPPASRGSPAAYRAPVHNPATVAEDLNQWRGPE